MPRPSRPRELRGKVFRSRAAIEAGLLTARQLQGRAWRRLFQGVYANSSLPETQYVVVDASGAFVARVDLAWKEFRLAVEYDGLWHVGSAQQMHDDRRRLNALATLGWTVLHVTSARLRDDFDGIVREIRAAMRRVR